MDPYNRTYIAPFDIAVVMSFSRPSVPANNHLVVRGQTATKRKPLKSLKSSFLSVCIVVLAKLSVMITLEDGKKSLFYEL